MSETESKFFQDILLIPFILNA